MKPSIEVAIIGHGRSPEGKGLGKFIDSFDIVVRLWNWSWQDPNDYGTKYDYGFYEITGGEMSRFHSFNCRVPSKGWVGSWLKPHEGPFPEPSEIIYPDRWERLGVELGGLGYKGRLRFTRGVRAAAWAIERMFIGGKLTLVGFDNVYAGIGLPTEQAFSPVYLSDPSTFALRDYEGGETKYSNHDYACEGFFLKRLAQQHGVEVLYLQDLDCFMLIRLTPKKTETH